jgi:hypothetical protein
MMDESKRLKLADHLQSELHDYCSGYMFSVEQVLMHIDEFFAKEESE